jgi:outer membrane cobalamin receptor
MATSRSVLILLSAAAIACAPPSGKRSLRNTNVITRQELEASVAMTAYDAIQRLRPSYLRTRGAQTFDPSVSTQAAVYLDGQRYGDITALRSMPVHAIEEIQYLSPAAATSKYGTDHTAGVIELVTRKR